VKQSDYKLDESSSHITQASLFNKILDKSSSTINSENKERHCPLNGHYYSHSITATDALLKHSQLDVNIKDNEGQMAIQLAAKWKDIDVEAFEIILRKTDEDNSKQPHLRESALDYAQESGSQDHHQRTSISYKRRWTNNNNSVKIHHILSNIAELDTTSPVISDIIK
jgi:hypothetical protein